MVEVLDFYDIPRLFVCTNAVGTLFVGLWYNETKTGDEWLYTPVSPSRLLQIRQGSWSLRDTFLKAEDGVSFLVKYDGQAQYCDVIPASEIEVENLPPVNDALSITEPLPDEFNSLCLVERVSPKLLASQRKKEIIDFAISQHGLDGQYAPIATIGRSLNSFQRIIEAIALRLLAMRNTTKQRKKKAKDASRIMAVGSFAGSFGLRLESAQSADLLGQSLVGDSLERFSTLLAVCDDEIALSTELQQLKPRVAASFRDFIGLFVERKTSFNYEWGSADSTRGYEAEFEIQKLTKVSSYVGRVISRISDEYDVIGILIGANLRTATFELHDVENGIKYSGPIASIGMPSIESAKLNNVYVATLLESVETKVASGRRLTEYQLLELIPFDH